MKVGGLVVAGQDRLDDGPGLAGLRIADHDDDPCPLRLAVAIGERIAKQMVHPRAGYVLRHGTFGHDRPEPPVIGTVPVAGHPAQRHRAFVEVLATGGIRFGEAAALRVGRCDLARSRITVAESLAEVGGSLHFGAPKTHQRRVVHLPRAVSDSLALEVEGRSDDELVFQAPQGGRIRYTNFVSRVWRPALRAARLPPMGLHALRHTCAAMLIGQGAHPKAIQSHLGHRSITTTLDRYGHLFDDVHERLAERVAAAYADILGLGAEDTGVSSDS